MNYLYSRIESDLTFRMDTPNRKAFYDHMQKVVKALHDIEWVDSSDYGPGDEDAAIMACISPADVLVRAIEDANMARYALEAALKAACG